MIAGHTSGNEFGIHVLHIVELCGVPYTVLESLLSVATTPATLGSLGTEEVHLSHGNDGREHILVLIEERGVDAGIYALGFRKADVVFLLVITVMGREALVLTGSILGIHHGETGVVSTEDVEHSLRSTAVVLVTIAEILIVVEAVQVGGGNDIVTGNPVGSGIARCGKSLAEDFLHDTLSKTRKFTLGSHANGSTEAECVGILHPTVDFTMVEEILLGKCGSHDSGSVGSHAGKFIGKQAETFEDVLVEFHIAVIRGIAVDYVTGDAEITCLVEGNSTKCIEELCQMVKHEHLSDVAVGEVHLLLLGIEFVEGLFEHAELCEDTVEVLPTVTYVTVLSRPHAVVCIGESDGLCILADDTIVPGIHAPVGVEGVLAAVIERTGHKAIASNLGGLCRVVVLLRVVRVGARGSKCHNATETCNKRLYIFHNFKCLNECFLTFTCIRSLHGAKHRTSG